MNIKNWRIPLALSLSLVMSGCTAEPAVTEEEILESYFSVFDSSGTVEGSDPAVYVAPGSPAETYASELLTRLEQGETDGLFSRDELVLSFNYSEPAEEGAEPLLEDVSLCFDSSDHPDSAREDFCFIHKDFEFSEGQLIGLQSEGDAIHGQIVLQYFGNHALAQPDDRIKAANYAVPGSNAEAYAIQQAQAAQASLDGGGFDSSVSELLYESGVLYSCYGNHRDPDALREDVCGDYSDFTFENDRLQNFNAGPSSLDGRIILGDGEIIPIGDIGTIEVLSAYETISGALLITAEIVSATETLNISGWDSVYLGESGRQVESSGTLGPGELKDGRVGNVSYGFGGATFGCELELEFYDENYNDVFVSIPIG